MFERFTDKARKVTGQPPESPDVADGKAAVPSADTSSAGPADCLTWGLTFE